MATALQPAGAEHAPAAVVAENLLFGQLASTALNQVWVSDITYLLLVGGCWCHLATWRGVCS